MKKLFFLTMLLMGCLALQAQDRYFTRTGHAYFLSHTDVIDIDGNNHQVTSFLNVKTGEMVFAVIIKSFEFTLATAEEHFNESYMESDVYPKSKFKGKIDNFESIDLTKEGKHEVTVTGDLTIHGVTKNITAPGTIEVKDGEILANSEFTVNIDDYGITVPSVVEERVAKVIQIKVDLTYLPYTK